MSTAWTQFVQSQTRIALEASDALTVGYQSICNGSALIDRTNRALLRITGADRASWLHNLTTNEVKNLGAGEGNYAFVLNLKGRIMFDMNICVRPDAFLVDLDARSLATALSHFEKYTIVEDVTIEDLSEQVERFGLTGPGVTRTLSDLGLTQVSAMPGLGTATLSFADSEITVIRHDFSGTLGVELIAEVGAGAGLWNFLASPDRECPGVLAGDVALDVHRIERGVPWYPSEINDEVLPGETGQLERSVSYQKGCYLGQEVVERMRSRGVLARKLRGLLIDSDEIPLPETELVDNDGQNVGRITSACMSIAKQSIVGLGYVKTGRSTAGTTLSTTVNGSMRTVVVSDLPLVALDADPV